MKVLAVGGGSGGHVTPIIAVLGELKHRYPRVIVRVWCDKAFARQARGIVTSFDPSIPIDTIYSGKFRRYHHLAWWQHLTNFHILLPNIRDGLLVIIGSVQSLVKLAIYRPDVVFTKGGFVCVPVGFAAYLLRIPLVIHDSDAHPGLANRILARWARRIATGAPLSYYPYPTEKTRYIGTPISKEFSRSQSASSQQQAKRGQGMDEHRPLLVVTGGGLGAARINDAIMTTIDKLLPMISVILVSGAGQYKRLSKIAPPDSDRWRLIGFVEHGMAELLSAADIVVTRAGATAVLEVAALAKPTILIPNGRLTGGHQLKNAAVLADSGAAVVINDNELVDNPDLLVTAVKKLVMDHDERERLSRAIHAHAKPHAAEDMAMMIASAARQR